MWQSATDTIRWVHDQDKIAINYLKSWFFLDFFSVGISGFDFFALEDLAMCGPASDHISDGFRRPLQQVVGDPAGGSELSTLRVLRIVRVARLVKLVRLIRSSRIMKRYAAPPILKYAPL